MSRLFPGGIHPQEGVNGKAVTGGSAIVELKAPQRVIIPLLQHVGAPATALVKKGDQVKVGQKIGEANGYVSACVHSSVSGKVFALTTVVRAGGEVVPAVAIDNDGNDEWIELTPAAHPETLSVDEFTAILRENGIVGMGGAGFPTAVKAKAPQGKTFDKLVVNGSECEPYLTADHRLMVEQAASIIDGIHLTMLALNIKEALVGIENNKPDAIEAMTRAASQTEGIKVQALPVRYPQGGEKQLIYALTKRKVPVGGLPANVGCLVINVATAAAIHDAIREGKPSVRRVMSVNGLVNKPGNFSAAVGTPLSDMIEAAGGLQDSAKKVLMGGPMMGFAIPNLDGVVNKSSSGLVALGAESDLPEESACIRCGRCVRACPMQLMPAKIDSARRHNNTEAAEKAGAMSCIECGSCTFACPANRPLTQSCRMVKTMIRTEKARKAAEEKKEA